MKMLARWKEGLFWRSESVTPWWIILVAETDWPTRTGKPSVPTGALLLRVRTRYRIGKQYQKDLALASWQKGGSSKPAWVVELSETEHGKYFREGIGSRGRLPASPYMVVSSTRGFMSTVHAGLGLHSFHISCRLEGFQKDRLPCRQRCGGGRRQL